LLASVLHYCSGNPLQNLSGVDRYVLFVVNEPLNNLAIMAHLDQ